MDKSWLRSAQVVMECGQLQEAYSFLLEVKHFHRIKFFSGASALAWARGCHTEAMVALRKGLQDTFSAICQALKSNGAQIVAKLEPGAQKMN